jgi:hypothetical protein
MVAHYTAFPHHSEIIVEGIEWAAANEESACSGIASCLTTFISLCRSSSPDIPWELVMSRLKGHASKGFRGLGYDGRLWQERFYDRILKDSENGIDVVNYVLENPVRAGIVACPDD